MLLSYSMLSSNNSVPSSNSMLSRGDGAPRLRRRCSLLRPLVAAFGCENIDVPCHQRVRCHTDAPPGLILPGPIHSPYRRDDFDGDESEGEGDEDEMELLEGRRPQGRPGRGRGQGRGAYDEPEGPLEDRRPSPWNSGWFDDAKRADERGSFTLMKR